MDESIWFGSVKVDPFDTRATITRVGEEVAKELGRLGSQGWRVFDTRTLVRERVKFLYEVERSDRGGRDVWFRVTNTYRKKWNMRLSRGPKSVARMIRDECLPVLTQRQAVADEKAAKEKASTDAAKKRLAVVVDGVVDVVTFPSTTSYNADRKRMVKNTGVDGYVEVATYDEFVRFELKTTPAIANQILRTIAGKPSSTTRELETTPIDRRFAEWVDND